VLVRQAAAGGSASGGASAHVLCFYFVLVRFLPIDQIIGVLYCIAHVFCS
jgi:hypothetical protein